MPRTLDAVARKTLGSNLKEIRERKQWSQLVAAKRAGIRRDRLGIWERGGETPGGEGLLLLAVAYGCSIDQFFSGVDEHYNGIIEERLPLDAALHYRLKTEAFIRRQTAAMHLIADVSTPVPKPEETAGKTVTARGKSSKARARRPQGTRSDDEP